jgi:Beta-lactamase class C and other penicillin binding proteins
MKIPVRKIAADDFPSMAGLITIMAATALMVAPCSAREPSAPKPLPQQNAAGGNVHASGDSTRHAPALFKASKTSALKPIDQVALQALVNKTTKELLIPGALVLLRTPQGDFSISSGTKQLGTKSPPTADTNFRIASNTKTMTAAIILQLAQEGKLSLNDPVSKFLPGVPNGAKITLSDLLKMRSGLYNCTAAPELSKSLDTNPTKVWTPQELLAIAFNHAPNAAPGTTFEYNNTNYTILGLVIEKVDGRPLAASMEERLFKPLNLSNTTLPASDSNAIPEPYSHGYLYGSSSVALSGEPPYTPEMIAAARNGTLLPKDYTDVNHSFATAAGGVTSTASDIADWIEALTTGRVFNAQYQRRWLDSVQIEDPKNPASTRYGYGIAHMHWGPNVYYYHGGETVGFNSFMGYDRSNKVTLVVWTNLTVALDQVVTANTLMLKVLDHIYKVSPIPPSTKAKRTR